MTDAPYHLAERGVSLGCQSAAEIEAGLATGRLRAEVFAWCEGEPRWVRLSQRLEFAPAVRAFGSLTPPVSPTWEGAGLFQRGSWSRMLKTFREVVFAPRETFAKLTPAGTARTALFWLWRCCWLSAPMLFLMGAFSSEQLTGPAGVLGKLRFGAAAVPVVSPSLNLPAFFKFFFLFPLTVVLLALTSACLVHALLRIFGGGKAGLRVTLRTLAYVLGAALLLLAIPLLGCVAPLIFAGLLIAALASAHADAAWKPLLAMGGLAVFGCCGGVGATIVSLLPFFRGGF